jgi:hypothetical protein
MAALALLGGVVLGGVADAAKKKGKKGGAAVNLTKTVNLGVPDAVMGPPQRPGQLRSTITVGKKFKGKSVGAVTVTYQTTGDDPNSVSGLFFSLIAPNGRTVNVGPAGGLGGQSIGPLTVTADSEVLTCAAVTPPCSDPAATLNRPFAGTAGNPDLALFRGAPMRGNWTLLVADASIGRTSILNFWAMSMIGAKPVK